MDINKKNLESLGFGGLHNLTFLGSPQKFTLSSSQQWVFVVSIDTEAIFMTLSPLKFVMLALNKYCTNDFILRVWLKVVILMTRL